MWEHKLKNRLLKTAARRLDDFFIFFLIAALKKNEILVILSKSFNNECGFIKPPGSNYKFKIKY